MNTITRSFKVYQLKAFQLNKDSGKSFPEFELIGECKTVNSRMDKTIARAELEKALGYKVPRGAFIEIEEVGSQVYAMDLDKFIENAVLIEDYC